MATVQIVLDKELLQKADEAARRTRQNRSALVREALRAHLRADWKYWIPEDRAESDMWAAEAVWPEE